MTNTIRQLLCESLFDATSLRDSTSGRNLPIRERELVTNLSEKLYEALVLIDAQNPDAPKRFQRTKITHIIETCSGCPSQWSGKTEEDEIFYARYRHGGLTVDVGNQRVYEENFQSEYGGDGVLSFDELAQHISHLFDFVDVTWVEKTEDLW